MWPADWPVQLSSAFHWTSVRQVSGQSDTADAGPVTPVRSFRSCVRSVQCDGCEVSEMLHTWAVELSSVVSFFFGGGEVLWQAPFWYHPRSIMRTVWSDANHTNLLVLFWGVFIDGCNAYVGICACRCSWIGQLSNYKLITTVAFIYEFMNDGVFHLFVRTVMCDLCVNYRVLITCWVFPYKYGVTFR